MRLPELSVETYETQKLFMSKNQKPERRGGRRENAGRAPDYRQRCAIYAIMISLGCSESTARRTLREYGGNLKSLIGSTKEYEVLQGWDELSEFDQGMVYGVLSARSTDMLRRGIGVRL
jgi:hypothetical protein